MSFSSLFGFNQNPPKLKMAQDHSSSPAPSTQDRSSQAFTGSGPILSQLDPTRAISTKTPGSSVSLVSSHPRPVGLRQWPLRIWRKSRQIAAPESNEGGF